MSDDVGRTRAGRPWDGRDLALWCAAASSVFVWVWLLAWYWAGGFPYDATSGVWTALASDWAHGTLYRPVHDAAGYGGTRYMPLFFVLHGWLIRAGVGPVAAGAGLTLASMLLFLGGLFAALRGLGATRVRAAGTALLLPGFVSVQLLTLATRGDLLAAGLLLLGLGAALSRRTPAAALLWSLAFAAKLVALWAPLVFGLWLLARGERARAWRLLGLTAAGAVAVLLAAMLASNGRMLASFAAAADGGATWRHALLAPWWLLYSARLDPFFLAVSAAALVLAVRRVRRVGWDVATLWAAGAALSTLLIFTSPGADSNHLLDMLAAALVLVALEAPTGEATAIAAVFAVAQLASQLPNAPAARHYFEAHGRPTAASMERIRRRLDARADPRPVLSQNPLLPILWDARAEVSDAFNLRLLAARDPTIAGEFEEKLRTHHYRAVILVDWTDQLVPALARPGGPAASVEEGWLDFPAGFMRSVNRYYRVAMEERPYLVLEPRP
jgi:hypothetical protein